MRYVLGLFVVVAGCSDKVITLSLNLPANATGYDATCLSSLDAYADGVDVMSNEEDYTLGTTTISSKPATLADVPAALEGKVSITIPTSGLGFVELDGWAGQSVFEDGPSGELVFYGAAPYVGQDTLDIDIVPNLSCAQKPVVVQPLDLIAYLTSTATDPVAKCAAAKVTTGTVYMGTLTTELVRHLTDYMGGLETATVTAAGTASLTGSTTMGPDDCLAFSVTNADNGATACAVYGAGLCSENGAFELALVSNSYVTNSRDPMFVQDFVGIVFGAVFTAAKAPQVGAVVTLDDPSKGMVVYVDLDATDQKLKPNGGTSTSTSGLFLVYATDVVDATITAGAITKKVRLGSIDAAAGNLGVPAPAPSSFTILMTPGTTP